MKIFVVNTGLTHTVARTRALSPYVEHIDYVDVSGKVGAEEVEMENITYHSAVGNGKSLQKNLKKLLDGLAPDVVVCHYISGTALAWALFHAKCPVVGIAMGTDVNYEAGAIQLKRIEIALRRQCWRGLDMIYAKSAYLKEQLRQYGIRAPIEVNYWGCLKPSFDIKSRLELRKNLGIPEQAELVLSIRGIAPSYHIDLIMEAFDCFCRMDDQKDRYLLLTGRTSSAHEGYRLGIEQMIAERGLTNRVRVCYNIPAGMMNAFVAAADIVVSMASSEGFPNSVLECWAMRRAAIVGDIPDIQELARDRKNVYLAAFSVDSLAEKMQLAAEDAELRETIIQAAYRDYCEFGDLDRNAAIFAQKLTNVKKYHKGFLFRPKLWLLILMKRLLK
jgi:glycosyltransferase involved in cell wall biosynthesis